ncbi:hypothetical protein sos41_29690 [Alphaproteobacteria bacterium SO-S41]|nr:hypothetical protein sos41_29690 [Alphaproteobacteria bacterium SO-S41]
MSRFRKVKRGVSVFVEGKWDGETLVVSQDIAFHDGGRDSETWRYKRLGDRVYEGRREGFAETSILYPDEDGLHRDYFGIMRSGPFRGMRVRYRYVMSLDGDGTLNYRGVVTKWGIRLGMVAVRAMPDAVPAALLPTGISIAA